MEIAASIVGIIAAYIWGHFLVLSFTKTWSDRNMYEQTVSIAAVVLMLMFVIGSV